jgi:hypothetical protein
VTAERILWSVLAWDIDNTRTDPLPIPAASFDFLRPDGHSLPIETFNTPLLRPIVKFGDRIVGSASVGCPDCGHGNTYVFCIKWGSGGWYAQIRNMTQGEWLAPANRAHLKEYINTLLATPTSARVPIESLGMESVPPSPAEPPATTTCN